MVKSCYLPTAAFSASIASFCIVTCSVIVMASLLAESGLGMDDVDWMAMDDEVSKQIRSEPPAACDDWSWSTEKKEEPLQGDKQQCLHKMFQENPGANRPAWADWANPRVADPAPSLGDRPRKASRLSASQKTALEKSAAAAHALAKKAADESEIACRRLAANAAKQKEETKVRQAGHPEKLDDNLTKDEKKPKDDVSSEKKPGNDVSSEKKPGDAVSSTPMPTGQSGGGKPVADAEKKRAPRNTMGTFAGYRPPADPEMLELFNLKKELYGNSRDEIEKMFPGRKVAFGRSVSQTEYYNFLKKKINALPKSPKPTQADVRACIKQASAQWRDNVAKAFKK